jgi:hypothetical protein
MTDNSRRKSKLVLIGILLILLAIFMPNVLIRTVAPSPLTLLWALLIDGLRLCFFIGIACVAIGWLRNRKLKSK